MAEITFVVKDYYGEEEGNHVQVNYEVTEIGENVEDSSAMHVAGFLNYLVEHPDLMKVAAEAVRTHLTQKEDTV